MEINPGIPSQRSPQDMAKEFDALWAYSEYRAESRPRMSLDELKRLSSRLRRMARLSVVPERESGTRRGEHYTWPASSRRAG